LPDAAAVDHYLSLYANDDTLDYGEDGRRAVEVLLAEGAAAGLLPACPPVDWAP
jgi:1,4-dihydroxy-6-naphthoate synthase